MLTAVYGVSQNLARIMPQISRHHITKSLKLLAALLFRINNRGNLSSYRFKKHLDAECGSSGGVANLEGGKRIKLTLFDAVKTLVKNYKGLAFSNVNLMLSLNYDLAGIVLGAGYFFSVFKYALQRVFFILPAQLDGHRLT